MQPRRSGRFVSNLTRSTMARYHGGRARLAARRPDRPTAPSLRRPFGGKFRIIDFPLSNCVNSGIRQIFVLTQYKAHSLIQHINRGWGYLRGEFGEFIQIVPAQQQLGEQWYLGTADSVYQNLSIVRERHPEHVLILAGDHIYKMDYGPMIAYHADKEADITVGVIEVPLPEASVIRRHDGRREQSHHSTSSRSRRTRNRCPARRTLRSRRWESTCSIRISSATS